MKKQLLLLISLLLWGTVVSLGQWSGDTRLTNDPGSSQMDGYPNAHSITSSGDTVHVVWKDNRDVNSDVYYKHYSTGNPVGIKELSSPGLQFTVFPNPVSSEINVRSTENINEITITDIYGKEIYHSGILNPSPELHIPVSGFPAGIYLIRVKQENRVGIQKPIIL